MDFSYRSQIETVLIHNSQLGNCQSPIMMNR